MTRDVSQFVGFYGPLDKTNPVYDPGEDADCMVCCKKLSGSIMQVGNLKGPGGKTFFFRTHKSCWARLNDHERDEYERSLTDHEVVIKMPPLAPTT